MTLEQRRSAIDEIEKMRNGRQLVALCTFDRDEHPAHLGASLALTEDIKEPLYRVLKDEVLGDIAIQAPTTIERLGNLRSLPRGFERSKWGEAIVAAVKRGLARDPKTLPRLERQAPPVNGQATVELLKVLLRMTAEKHAVAAKVIATVDDLDRIAADDAAEVPALSGWRRQLFGEKALALKHGRLALAVERGRVVAVERSPARAVGSTERTPA